MYDALLVVSFGGPEAQGDVIPFLENVLRGKNVPRERMLEVAEHSYHFGGKSPINDQNRALIAALHPALAAAGISLPIYWGNRNWQPMLADTLRQMANDGVKRALAYATSAFSSYSGCRQYRQDIAAARAAVGDAAPEIDKLRVFFNHPGFIGAVTARVRDAFDRIPAERRAAAALIYTAHSIPISMSQSSDYVAQLRESAGLVTQAIGHGSYSLVYQSRSGPPSQPWLEPDIGAHLREIREAGVTDAVVVPLGFISDHMEVLFDLDTEAAELSNEIGLNMVRAGTAGTHPDFVGTIVDLVAERLDPMRPRLALGTMGIRPDVCPPDCCAPPTRR